jgi:TolB protein
MNLSLIKTNRFGALRWSMLMLLVSCTGCAHLGVSPLRSTSKDRQDQTGSSRPMLAAMRAGEVNMFGEISNGSHAAYFTRSAVGLYQNTFGEEGGDFDPDVDAEGKLLVFSSTRHNLKPDLYVKAVEGIAVTQLTSDPNSDTQPIFSPDGTRVAFASDRSGNWDIWVIDVAGTHPIQVTDSPGDELHPSWSPDGDKLVFCSLPAGGGQWELWIADAAAGGLRRFVGYGLFPDWSPTGDTILYQRARERGSRWFSVWTVTLVDGEPRYPTEVASSAAHAMILPSWSQDGQRIAYTAVAPGPMGGIEGSLTSGTSDIWMMAADGRARVRLTDAYTDNYAPTFDNQGRVFFTSGRSGQENVWSLAPGAVFPDTPGTGRITGLTGRPHMASTVIESSSVEQGE